MPLFYQSLSDAFSFLSPSRSIGFGGVGYIPITEILAYHSIYGLGYSRADFVEVIRAIDLEFVQLINAANGPDKIPQRRNRS